MLIRNPDFLLKLLILYQKQVDEDQSGSLDLNEVRFVTSFIILFYFRLVLVNFRLNLLYFRPILFYFRLILVFFRTRLLRFARKWGSP